MDTVGREQVEADLDRLITKRHDQRVNKEQGRIEDGWVESVRRYNARQEAAREAARYKYHRDQAERLRRTLEELIARHEAAAERYLRDEPKGETA